MAEVKREHRMRALSALGWSQLLRMEHWLENGGDTFTIPPTRAVSSMVEENAVAQAIADAEERGAARALAEVWAMPGYHHVLCILRAELNRAIEMAGNAADLERRGHDVGEYHGEAAGNADALAAMLKLLEGEP